jgi:hypothetical protein
VRALRKLVLGETWVLPIGVALAVGAAALLRAASDGAAWWHDAGGVILAILVLAALAYSVFSSARG